MILDVEITVPQGREARIQIHKGESIETTVKQFCSIWDLSGQVHKEIKAKIVAHLAANNLLDKTQEGCQPNLTAKQIISKSRDVAISNDDVYFSAGSEYKISI